MGSNLELTLKCVLGQGTSPIDPSKLPPIPPQPPTPAPPPEPPPPDEEELDALANIDAYEGDVILWRVRPTLADHRIAFGPINEPIVIKHLASRNISGTQIQYWVAVWSKDNDISGDIRNTGFTLIPANLMHTEDVNGVEITPQIDNRVVTNQANEYDFFPNLKITNLPFYIKFQIHQTGVPATRDYMAYVEIRYINRPLVTPPTKPPTPPIPPPIIQPPTSTGAQAGSSGGSATGATGQGKT